MLRLYGTQLKSPTAYRLRLAVLPITMFYLRTAYRRLSRRVAARIEDYLASGFSGLA